MRQKLQVPSGRSTSSANFRGKQSGKHLPPHRQRTSVARHKTDIGQNQAVRREGEQLVREAEQLMRRDEEEEADMDWVRKRMQEVQLSSVGETAPHGRERGGGLKVSASVSSGVKLEGRGSHAERRGFSREVRESST